MGKSYRECAWWLSTPRKPAWWWGKKGVRAQNKESEQKAGPLVSSRLNLDGKVVTGDALYAHRELSRYVAEQAGDYFW